ncbi:MAG: Trm112 family protein [Candidatus Omnitrophica bacterium]|nr:Trm112 family protein [Candidatus Omnitrophota bacterium]
MIDAALLDVLACPACHSKLRQEKEELICTGAACGLAFPVRDGIPVLLAEEARRP